MGVPANAVGKGMEVVAYHAFVVVVDDADHEGLMAVLAGTSSGRMVSVAEPFASLRSDDCSA